MLSKRWLAVLLVGCAAACGDDEAATGGAGGAGSAAGSGGHATGSDGGGGGGGDGPGAGGDAPSCSSAKLDPDQKRRAEQLTSLFENGTVEIDYAYAEALDDGRGITAGRAGFTTATGDLLEVVEIYTGDVGDAPLADYLPRLRELAEDEDGSIEGLDGLTDDWADAAEDPVFRAAQDAVVDELYYQPVLVRANDAGVCLPLTVAALYDAIIQHGEGDDPDGFPALVERTDDEVGASPKGGADEEEWLRAFLAVRRADLEHAYDEETREVWAESAGRCDVWREIADDDNWELDGPIEVDRGDYQGTVE